VTTTLDAGQLPLLGEGSGGARYAEVVVDVARFDTLTYLVPHHLDARVAVGHLVQVPFRNRAKTGVVVRRMDVLDDPALESKLRAVYDLMDPQPAFTPGVVRFMRIVADYYMAPLSLVIRLALPAAMRTEGMKHYGWKGEGGHSGEPLPTDLRAAVEAMRSGTSSVDGLKTSSGLSYDRLAELERRDLVEVSYRDVKKPPVKLETYLRLAEGSSPVLRGRKQREIIEFLRESQKTSLSALRSHIPSPHASLRGLVDKGLVESWTEEIFRDPFRRLEEKEDVEVELLPAQQEACDRIEAALESRRFQPFLLHGVTGSGKTEVYMRVIGRAIEMGNRALVLLPEIALTPQFVSVFRARFKEGIAVLHSGLSPAERYDQWCRIRRSQVNIVIGARSALYAPLSDVGIIVVDEEHDPSFKQDDGIRYHARDMALVRAKIESAVVVLGSATPSMESYHNALQKRFVYLRMESRVGGHGLPEMSMVDLRRAQRGDSEAPYFSVALRQAVQKTVAEGHQTILFLNRRGYSPCVLCDGCGHIWQCPDCAVSLTYHRDQEILRCHHCDYGVRLPEKCPSCGDRGVGPRGVGTQKLEEYLRDVVAVERVARLDRDTGVGRRLQEMIQSFSKGEIDVLVGTQMVTKGHDFPRVQTVGVVLADIGLNFPDFRAAERTFQLLVQVAGRAGRGAIAGQVLVQTYNPEHYALVAAKTHDYEAFQDIELGIRRDLQYPPFSHLIALKFESSDEAAVYRLAHDYAASARRRIRGAEEFGEVVMLGPALAPLERLRGRMRYQILFKCPTRGPLRKMMFGLLGEMGLFDPARDSRIRVAVDVDPQNLL
jgi:primosomal protein N' (replication factor Y) (superfamily II helicase)